jgi:hypothetical protein
MMVDGCQRTFAICSGGGQNQIWELPADDSYRYDAELSATPTQITAMMDTRSFVAGSVLSKKELLTLQHSLTNVSGSVNLVCWYRTDGDVGWNPLGQATFNVADTQFDADYTAGAVWRTLEVQHFPNVRSPKPEAATNESGDSANKGVDVQFRIAWQGSLSIHRLFGIFRELEDSTFGGVLMTAPTETPAGTTYTKTE